MNKNVIKMYVENIKKDDIYNFGLKQGINLTTNELDTIYTSIKNDTDEILEDVDKYLLRVRNKLSLNTYNVINDLLNKYKKFIT